MGLRAAVLGASGYAGGELVRILDGHPHLDLVFLGAHARAGSRLDEVHPHLDGGDRLLEPLDDVPEVDVAFLALPHGESAVRGAALAESCGLVVDLSADFRLDTPERYRRAYGREHPVPDQLGRWVYGLPELFDVSGARRIASPGCYPTAVLLASVPLLRAGLVGPGTVVADCLSGASGAGRSLREDLLFGEVAEGMRAYGVTTHRHRPEIEMALGRAVGEERPVVFTPHLVPIQRGELATVTLPAVPGIGRDDLLAALESAYRDRPFVQVVDHPPQSRWVVGSNRALVTAYHDEAAGSIVALAAIDNLLKGAAGQAVQAANIALGLPETEGLPRQGFMP
jgi:N-acetyl-gamma-glutamyl-phosphate reductase